MSYNTPPLTTVTTQGSAESYSSLQDVPALLTRFEASEQCSTEYYWDTGALRSSSTVFIDGTHNSKWSTCQPYHATSATYSAGICPQKSEFKTVTQISWEDVATPYYMGACCGSTATFGSYSSGDSTDLVGCIATITESSVGAVMVQENSQTTQLTSAGPVTVIAAPMYMIWHQNDTSLHPLSDANSLRAAMGMALVSSTNTSSSPTSTSTSEASSDSSSSGIPMGAIVGIVVAFVVCLIAIGVLGYLAFLRRYKSKEAARNKTWSGQGPSQSSRHPYHWNSNETDGNQLPSEIPNSSIKGNSFVELHAVDSTASRTLCTSSAAPVRTETDEFHGVEQKMLLR